MRAQRPTKDVPNIRLLCLTKMLQPTLGLGALIAVNLLSGCGQKTSVNAGTTRWHVARLLTIFRDPSSLDTAEVAPFDGFLLLPGPVNGQTSARPLLKATLVHIPHDPASSVLPTVRVSVSDMSS